MTPKYDGYTCDKCGREMHPVETHVSGICSKCEPEAFKKWCDENKVETDSKSYFISQIQEFDKSMRNRLKSLEKLIESKILEMLKGCNISDEEIKNLRVKWTKTNNDNKPDCRKCKWWEEHCNNPNVVQWNLSSVIPDWKPEPCGRFEEK